MSHSVAYPVLSCGNPTADGWSFFLILSLTTTHATHTHHLFFPCPLSQQPLPRRALWSVAGHRHHQQYSTFSTDRSIALLHPDRQCEWYANNGHCLCLCTIVKIIQRPSCLLYGIVMLYLRYTTLSPNAVLFACRKGEQTANKSQDARQVGCTRSPIDFS